MAQNGKVYLVGAGPGDPNLITVKGLECIRQADVIVYDRLAGSRLLSFACKGCELINVGKSPQGHALRQEEINRLLVRKAQEGRKVARLKGGDPFVFGRGGEEALELAAAGVEFEIVPGVTSAVAVPAYAGIPVTQRGLTSTLAIVTGNEDPEKEDSDIQWDKLATGAGTLVLLMGMANLRVIVQKLLENGRPASTPVAIIQWGTLPDQRTVTGTLENIVEICCNRGLANPAVIVVGEVVGLREKIAWLEKRPLFGWRVVVTRSRDQASVLSQKIEALGGQAWEFPTIEIKQPEDFSQVDSALDRLQEFDWLVFTSANGVDIFFQHLCSTGRDVRTLAGLEVVAIGPATQAALAARGILAAFVPEEYRAEALAAGLAERGVAGRRVLLARADIARKVLPETLLQLGAQVEEVAIYRTVRASNDVASLLAALEEGDINAITFTSSSTVRNFAAILAEAGVKPTSELLAGPAIAAIGPVTAEAARDLGFNVKAVAGKYTIDGLIQALLELKQYGDSGKPMPPGLV